MTLAVVAAFSKMVSCMVAVLAVLRAPPLCDRAVTVSVYTPARRLLVPFTLMLRLARSRVTTEVIAS